MGILLPMNDAATETKALEILTWINTELPAFKGNLQSFAYSIDTADVLWALAFRERVSDLALLVYRDVDLACRCDLALAWACRNDKYAAAEVAGRFASAVKRIRIAQGIEPATKIPVAIVTKPRKRMAEGCTVGVCLNCYGLGKLEHFKHIESGVCFWCKGDGVILYTERQYRGKPQSEWPRALRLEVIAQALDAFTWIDADPFLMRNRKKVNLALIRFVRELAVASDVVVFDRAMAAMGKVTKLDAAKVAALRAKKFTAESAAA